jgi:hypothetical protein
MRKSNLNGPLAELAAKTTNRARTLGSDSKTLSGALRFLKTHPQPNSVRGGLKELDARFDRPGPPQVNVVYTWYELERIKRHHYERRTYLEARRARKDPSFRRNFIRRLQRQAASLTRFTTLLGFSRLWDERQEIEKQLTEIDTQLKIATGGRVHRQAHLDPFRLQMATIAVSDVTAVAHRAEVVRRGKDWEVASTFGRSRVEHTEGWTAWKNGVPRSYHRATNVSCVRSFARVRDGGRTLVYLLHEGPERVIPAPSGTSWDIDANGIRLVFDKHREDDYHPDADDLLRGPEELLQKLLANRQLRLANEAKAEAELAELEGVHVCLADSVRAGNCRAGSVEFALRLGLDARRHYRAGELLATALKQAPDSVMRLRLALRAAFDRHQREMQQGFALLSDHS